MVIYFVEVDDNQTQRSLNNSVLNMDGVEFQGILNNYKNENDKRVAIFVVSFGVPQFKFKRKYANSTQRCPANVPPEVFKFFSICI